MVQNKYNCSYKKDDILFESIEKICVALNCTYEILGFISNNTGVPQK